MPKNEFTVFLTLESYDENFGASLFKYSCESVPSQGLSIFCTSTYHKMACNSTKAPKNNMQGTQKYNFDFALSVKIWKFALTIFRKKFREINEFKLCMPFSQ